MCLPADQIIATPAAKFGMGFIKMGLVPELASTRLLAARVGLRPSQRPVPVAAGSSAAPRRTASASPTSWPSPTSCSTRRSAIAGELRGQPRPAAADDQAAAHREHGRARPALRCSAASTSMLIECWASPEHAEAVDRVPREAPGGVPAAATMSPPSTCSTCAWWAARTSTSWPPPTAARARRDRAGHETTPSTPAARG